MTQPFAPAAFPYARPRRLRSSPWVRRLVAETVLTPADLVWPLIVHDGAAVVLARKGEGRPSEGGFAASAKRPSSGAARHLLPMGEGSYTAL